MARGDGSGFCGFAKGFLVSGSSGSLSDRPPLAKNPGGGRTGPPREVVEISSDEEEDDGSTPVARKLRFDDAADERATGGSDLGVGKKRESRGVGKEDDDCVVLDSDPDGAVPVGEDKGTAGLDGGLDELQIVAEKGQVACRDFPHSRHLCSKLPFSTTLHVTHCSMCYCFVCDAPAPCTYWGKGLSTDDHCHATDKETRWTTLRQAFKRKHLPASHSEKHQNVVYPAMVPLRQQDIQRRVSALQSDPSFLSGFSRFSLTDGSPIMDVVHQNQQRHILQGVLPNAGQTVGAPRVSHLTREGRGRDNVQTTQATRLHTPCGQEPYQQEDDEEYTSEEEDEEYTSEEEDEEYTSQEDGEYTSEKAKVYVGNLHYDIVREDLDELFGQAGFVEFSEVVYSRQTWQSCGFGFVTMSTVKEAELAVEMFNGFKMHGRRLTVQHKAARRVARVEAPLCQSKSPFRLYVGNLPSQASDSWLKALFSQHGKVVEARVVDKEHDGRALCSRGFGFVKMATEEESYVAIEALDKQIMEGRPLRVEVAKERPR
ncbi:uncharacterized protein [Lolium perenne]|uniref:uncharacterized protein isoform X1 n=1 Tax=Lolium perenne TaxID=4522 RepID=UPI0021EA343D|nr:uncharacterized protein LOC127335159 isoform X1 [Lolium perenne]